MARAFTVLELTGETHKKQYEIQLQRSVSKMKPEREFPGGPVVRIPSFPHHGRGSIPGQITEIPTSHKVCLKKKSVKQDVVTSDEEPQEEPTAKVTRVVRRKGTRQTFRPSSDSEF